MSARLSFEASFCRLGYAVKLLTQPTSYTAKIDLPPSFYCHATNPDPVAPSFLARLVFFYRGIRRKRLGESPDDLTHYFALGYGQGEKCLKYFALLIADTFVPSLLLGAYGFDSLLTEAQQMRLYL